MTSANDITGLADRFEEVQRELVSLLGYVKRTKAALEQSSDELSHATDALSSIGDATEKAAHNLLSMVEKVMNTDEQASKHLDALEGSELDGTLREAVDGVYAAQDERTNILTEMMTELSFQDLTCQTIEKVVRGLNNMESRILNILDPNAPSPEEPEKEAVHAGSMSGLSRLEENLQGNSKQDMVDQLLGR